MLERKVTKPSLAVNIKTSILTLENVFFATGQIPNETVLLLLLYK